MNDKTVLEVRRPAPSIPESQPALPSFAEAVRVWMKIGLLSFGAWMTVSNIISSDTA